jgi:hypothetical protein
VDIGPRGWLEGKQGESLKMWNEFLNMVNHHFKYLETEFGFKRTLTEIPFVIYESQMLRINIFWEYGGRYELGLSIRSSEKYKIIRLRPVTGGNSI